jgi:hypothetical protein
VGFRKGLYRNRIKDYVPKVWIKGTVSVRISIGVWIMIRVRGGIRIWINVRIKGWDLG